MRKAVLISIRPKWCQKIASGEKTIEIRKNRPKLAPPFKCYIYCTIAGIKKMPKDYLAEDFERGKVIGEFVCDKIEWLVHVGFMGVPEPPELRICDARTMVTSPADALLDAACLSAEEMRAWLGLNEGYGWHISDFRLYDKPRDFGEFERPYECGECDAQWATECNACYEEKKVKRAPQSWCYVMEDTNGKEDT